MSEQTILTKTLPALLSELIRTDRVRIIVEANSVRIIPVEEQKTYTSIRGLCSDGLISSYSFMERKVSEKELER